MPRMRALLSIPRNPDGIHEEYRCALRRMLRLRGLRTCDLTYALTLQSLSDRLTNTKGSLRIGVHFSLALRLAEGPDR
jgi:hypothetical protein